MLDEDVGKDDLLGSASISMIGILQSQVLEYKGKRLIMSLYRALLRSGSHWRAASLARFKCPCSVLLLSPGYNS